MEILTEPERRRRRTAQEKIAIVQETLEPGASVSAVARRHGVNANQVFGWRKQYQEGSLAAVKAGETVVPASELAAAIKEIKELQRLLGKKTLEVEILKEAVEWGRFKKPDCALALAAGGRPMKTVCEVLGVARSAVAVKRTRSSDWRDGRRARMTNDAGLVEEIQAHVAHLPTYGYRRVWALLRRSREQTGAPCINAKRVYRVMREHQLLLRRPGVRRDKRRHDGRVAVDRSNTRWCSDGFEFRCDDGTPLRVTFALDCCDREAISWAATTSGHSGDVVRDVMLAAVEQRFGTTQAAQPIEWLTDNGSAYIDHRTRSFARELGLEPLTTPVRSPQSNGMAESFVKTMKHNYVAYMDKSDAPTALSRLAIAFEHYNERHPHKALKYRSPREFRRNAVSST
ncbi:IS3 family transposase [Pandoraea sp. XJJ-1]|uniref:IS3 family transposase n=2 Tax=Pandoraea TaxID=93217 RepID=A0ABY5QN88_9BURK|nr:MULTISPECIES: IS3 family transposase [Pandoraea]MBN8745888.1 IS3 family transposase [Variovorax sp.]UVA82129.1 IS3 family transposase [Pandoraea commovens]WAL85160.1 IS3 family transposase [Pandoraea sp. XJJ-1]WAL85224.1 IS3 family transposase [Pandoraea sp. XJJ-1]WAL85254.1 IS3 family transposase [Pandoraea sp. XJJ-1]